MKLNEVVQVTQVIGDTNANARLKDGWKLLAVVSASAPGGASSAMYVLGKGEAKTVRESVPPASMVGVSKPRR